jgi:hypothetical protein
MPLHTHLSEQDTETSPIFQATASKPSEFAGGHRQEDEQASFTKIAGEPHS